ncbi:alpha/beta hydrolase family protein [Nocardioides alcanivorans]|uniref:alpha/beta hydrolase family protein n=1 Tax=Nocardioides alcanivorans TaxID=2897352 RepID=UPI001F47E2BD|nr:prolyl oligopeptidase family serine peptidase [Nocardioides alcanivorans]
MKVRRRWPAGVLATLLVLTGCTSTTSEDPDADPSASATSPSSDSPTPDPTAPTSQVTEPPHPISLAALGQADLTGGDLRLGAVREQTAAFTSYDVTFASTWAGAGTGRLRISGVLNVPTGPGPFPAVVLAHGYVDPAIYKRGQGMTRERGRLADRGFVALHVDYRNHAESTDDPRVDTAVRLGYTVDVIAAVHALRDSTDVAVDPDRIALFGRSMGGGVVLKALALEPGLVAAGVTWASVSSLEAQNFEHFIASDASRADLRAALRQRHGLPDDDPAFWRGISARPAFDQITEPVLMAHGRYDDTCPPQWARASQRTLTAAGVDSTLEWYDDGHAFGPAFDAAMDRTVTFLQARMPG